MEPCAPFIAGAFAQTAAGDEYRAAAARGELLVQQCNACGEFRSYPRAGCPRCGSAHWSWIISAGKGKILTWTRVHRAPSAEFNHDLPYVVVVVELDDGPALMSRLVCATGANVQVGQLVEALFVKDASGMSVPLFTCAGPCAKHQETTPCRTSAISD